MPLKLQINSYSGAAFEIPFEITENGNVLYLDGKALEIKIERSYTDTASPYIITFIPRHDIRLSCVRIISELPSLENKGEESCETYIYDAACCTNAFARILKYEGENTDSHFFSRDIFMAESRDKWGGAKHLNIAFATFRRFYTRFRLSEGKVIAEFNLENKTVTAGEKYELEHIIIDTSLNGALFFEKYTEYLSNMARMAKYVPRGWSSWSCFYGNIDENKIIKQSELMAEQLTQYGADIIQLDDGWQEGGSFAAHWTTDKARFPEGIEALQHKISELGMRFGIWIAPGLIADTSSLFDEMMPLLTYEERADSHNAPLKCFGGGESPLAADKDGSVYALDIGKSQVTQLTNCIFKRLKNEYGAVYFKIDFITNLLIRMAFGTPVTYQADYSVSLYKKWTGEIRKTVGEDSFMLACGAPIGESIGIFDSIRISPDISWGGAGRNGMPQPFEIIRNDVQNIILRSPYHGRVFINDPDALLVRDFVTEHGDDALALTYDEAKLWATAVFMSGGHILLNEEIDRLTPERLDIVKKVFEFSDKYNPKHAAARARDFFEYPYCTQSYIPFQNDISHEALFTRMAQGEKLGEAAYIICAVFNWSDAPDKRVIRAQDYFEKYISGFRALDIWSGDEIYFDAELDVGEMPPHSCRLFRISRREAL